jgi:hypothetical protein
MAQVSAPCPDGRFSDAAPVELEVSADPGKHGRRLDPATIEIRRCSADGKLLTGGPLPFRWYDAGIPYEYPECEQNVHGTDGVHLQWVRHPRWGDFHNALGEGLSGRLVWEHRQAGRAAGFYRISYRLLPPAASPARMPPRGFVGDGSHRCGAAGATSTGSIHSRLTITDWNGDGLPDLLVGGGRGQVLVYPNRGSRTRPAYPFGKLVFTEDGRPLDVGWSAAPHAVDWDQDGKKDLLVGGERNRLLFFRNVGTNSRPEPRSQGFVQVSGRPLELPVTPVPKAPPGVFTLDYYPVVDVVDWDGDEQRDLLVGGYITGRIYLYRTVGRLQDGTPRLEAAGPLEADGKVLNVGDWAAAPCGYDFDSDGDLDLVSGSMPITSGGGDSTDPDHFLRYWENTGSPTRPRLAEKPFPKQGRFPNAILGTPRAADLNGDGIVDLAVSANENLYLYFNRGSRTRPRWDVGVSPLPAAWGSLPLPTFGLQVLPHPHDGGFDLLSGLTRYRSEQRGAFTPEPLLPPGLAIDHPTNKGDGWRFTQLADLDGDGTADLLYGTHAGEIWLHRGERTSKPARWAADGERLRLTNGQTLRVGPVDGQPLDFDRLQGARITFSAADFDGDHRLDLAVGDTYGKLRVFLNQGGTGRPQFAPGIEIGDLRIRMTPCATDWDGDGKVDVLGSAANGRVEWFKNLGGGWFGPGVALKIPEVPYGPSVVVTDWNGDGDQDLLVGTAYGYFCWFERSFLERGYSRATWSTTR